MTDRTIENPTPEDTLDAFMVARAAVIATLDAMIANGQAANAFDNGFVFAARTGEGGETYDLTVQGSLGTSIVLTQVLGQEIKKSLNDMRAEHEATAVLG